MSEALARRARTLLRAAKTAGWRLPPADSIHVASALLAGARRVLTYEKASMRARWTDLIGIPVEEPVSDRLPLD